eukprot:scaffold20812_cov111-Isochrysis_galbana.AAC.3
METGVCVRRSGMMHWGNNSQAPRCAERKRTPWPRSMSARSSASCGGGGSRSDAIWASRRAGWSVRASDMPTWSYAARSASKRSQSSCSGSDRKPLRSVAER